METVVLIESDPANLLTLAMLLRCLGCRVLEARTPGEAWVPSTNHPEPIDSLYSQGFSE